MFTWGSKYFFGLSVAALVAALLYAIVSGGTIIGGASLGWKGGVGDHLGYAVLLGLSVGLFVLGTVAVWVRDAEAEDVAVLAGTPDRVPQALPPARPSYWGAITAFAVGSLIVGATLNSLFIWLGVGLLLIIAIEWAVLAWTDRATGDPQANTTLRNRLMQPIEVPLFGAAGIAAFAIGVSRVLLAVSKTSAVVIASVVAVAAFGLAIAFVYRQEWFSRRAVSMLVTGFAGLVLVGGVVAASVGPREFEHHGPEHGEEHGEAGTPGEGQGGTAPGPGEDDPAEGTRRGSGEEGS